MQPSTREPSQGQLRASATSRRKCSPEKGTEHPKRQNQGAQGIPNSMDGHSRVSANLYALSVKHLSNRELAELQRLNNNGLLVVAKATAERYGSSDEHDSGDNALQTLHGLLSFVKTAIAVFACTGAAQSDQDRTGVLRPFCQSMMRKCHAESHPLVLKSYPSVQRQSRCG